MSKPPPEFREVFKTAVAMAVLATIAVFLRLLAKRCTKTGLKADDVWILLGLASFWVYVGLIIWGVFARSTRVDVMNRAVKTAIMTFGVSITATKISILCLYHRLFPTPVFRRATVLLGVICVLWLMAAEIVFGLQCMSILGFWDKRAHSCIDVERYFLSTNITETIIDFAILCLPLRVVSSLQLPPRQKTVLYMTFLVGGFACITGIVRTVLTYPQTGSPSSFTNGLVWSNTQLGTSIVSACLPIYRPLLAKCALFHASVSSSYRSLLSNRQFSKDPPAGGPSHDDEPGRARSQYTHFGGPHDDQSRLTKVTGGRVKGAPVVVNANLPLHSISVRSSIEIV